MKTMFKRFLSLCLLPLATCPLFAIDLPEGLQGFNMRAYEKRELRPGVTYFKTDFDKKETGRNLFGQDGPCAIYWLVMEWDICGGRVSLDIAYNENGWREMPTTWAQQRDAFAWVNGSYHKTTDPSAPIYELKVRGKEVLHNPYDQSLLWDRGGFGNVLRTANINLNDYEYAISGDGYVAYKTPDFSDTSKAAIDARQAGRASRTFAGAIPDKRITIIGAADGRFSGGSIGLECNEERWLLGMWGVDLDHCVNLDGGGSTMCGLKEGDDYVLQSKPSNEKPERRVHHSIELVDIVGKFVVRDTPHGTASITPEVITNVAIGATLDIDFRADDGYAIAAIMTNGVPVAGISGAPRTYRLSLVAYDGLCEIGVAYAKANAWWINPTVKNDFLVEAKSGSGWPAICMDEQEENIYFSRSTHSYNASSALTGIIGFNVGDLRNRAGGQTGEPILKTTNPNAEPGKYVYDLAVSKAAGIAYETHKTGAMHGAIQPLDGSALHEDTVSFPDDKNSYHTTRRIAFSTDGAYLWGGYNANAHIHEFAVYTDGATGKKNVRHTGKVMKFKAANDAIAVRRVNGQDMIFAAEHGGTAPNGVTNLAWCVPGTMAVATNSSSIPVTVPVKKKFDSIAVVGVRDGTPRLIGHINNTADPNNGGYAVYELKNDYSGLLYPNPIVEFSSTEVFGKATGYLVATEDETLAFINYLVNNRELRAMTVTGDESAAPRGEMYIEGEPATYGEPTPAYGRRVNLEAGEIVNCSAPATVKVGAQTAVCTGYQLLTNMVDNIGNWLVWKNGEGNSLSFEMPEDVTVRLKWLWDIRAEAGFGAITTTGGTDASFTASAEVTGVGLGEGDSLDVKVVWKAKAYCYTNNVATVTEPGVVSLKVDRMVMPGVTYYVRFLALDKNGSIVVETEDKKTVVPMGTDGNTFVMESEPVEIGSPYPEFGKVITGLPIGATFEGYASYQQKGTPRAVFSHWTLYKKDANGDWRQAATGNSDYHFTYVNDDGKDQKLVWTYNYWDEPGVKDVTVEGGTDASLSASACVTGVGMNNGDQLSFKIAWGLSEDNLAHTNEVGSATGYGSVALKITKDVIPGATYYTKLFALDKNGAITIEHAPIAVTVPIGTAGNTLAIEGAPLAIGTSLPAYGTLTGLPATAAFDCTVTERIEDATQRKNCTGWALYKKDAQGLWQLASQGTTATFRYDNADAVDQKLVWQWEVRAIPGLGAPTLSGNKAGWFDVAVDVTGVGLSDEDSLTVFAAWGLREDAPVHTNLIGVANSVGEIFARITDGVYPGDSYPVHIYAVDKLGQTAVALPPVTVAIPDDGEDRTPAATMTLASSSSSGMDYNGYELIYDLDGLNLGRYNTEDIRVSYTLNGNTYEGETIMSGDAIAGFSFSLAATGENAILAGNAYCGNYRIWFESDERGATETLDSGITRFVAGVETTENTDWFNEIPTALGQTGEWQTASGDEPEIEIANGYMRLESADDDPIVFTPTTPMQDDSFSVIETRFLFEDASDTDSPGSNENVQCALRIVREDEDDATSPCIATIWAALSDGAGGWDIAWHRGNVCGDFAFERGCEYTVRFEIDYLGDSYGAPDTLSCLVHKDGTDGFVKIFTGYPVNVNHGGLAAAGRASLLKFVGTGKVAQLNGTYDITNIDTDVARVGLATYETIAAAVDDAQNLPVEILHLASWRPAIDDAGKKIDFINRELLVLDMSALGEGYTANWTEKGEVWELVISSASPWIDHNTMDGETENEKATAAMRRLGFNDKTTAIVAGASGGYATLKAWAERLGLSPEDVIGRGGVLLSAAIDADKILTGDDIRIEAIEPNDDGGYTLAVSVADSKNLLSANQELLKAAIGAEGAYELEKGGFGMENVEVAEKTVSDEFVQLKAMAKAISGEMPTRFFFKATAR